MKKRKNTIRLIAALCMILFMMVAMLPQTVMRTAASQIDIPADTSGTVYISYSHDGQFAAGLSDSGYMTYVPVSIEALADVDPAAIGEEDLTYELDGEKQTTALMLFKYALDLYGEGSQDLMVTQGPGQAYLYQGAWHDNGTPWDENLNYYINGMYPLKEDGRGASCDQVTLHDGDFIDVMHYSGWEFHTDAEAGYQYFGNEAFLADLEAGTLNEATIDGAPGYIEHAFSAETGIPFTAGLLKAYGNLTAGGNTFYQPFDNTVYYSTELYGNNAKSTEAENGQVSITFTEPGLYYMWTEGTEGESGMVVNAPAYATVNVTGESMQGVFITAPSGSTVTAGSVSRSFQYTWYDPVKTVTLKDGRTQSFFKPVSGNSFFRVQHPEGVTYWDFQSLKAGKSYEVSASDLKIDDPSFAKDTVYKEFVYNYVDLGDIYLNINERNCLALEKGATREINAFRNWQAIEGYSNSKIAIPDMHYEVVDINGNPSDLVTITPDPYNTGHATLKACEEETGLAVVKVTYDAMIHKQGIARGYGAGGEDPTRFSAIWPECTGVFVVSVGQDGSAIDMGMKINVGTHAGKIAGDHIDAEHDLLYYFDDKGAEFTFTPEEGAAVSVARCALSENSLSFHGFTTEGILTDEEGHVTVTGLTDGRHIVRVEKDGLANYQVLSARYVELEILDEEGNPTEKDHEFEPGDKLTLVLHNVDSPQEKFAGCYNNSFSVAYYGEDAQTECLAGSNAGTHGYGQYNFSSMDQTLTVTIPETWNKDTYSIKNGAVAMAGFSGTPAGGHRTKAYGTSQGIAVGTAGSGVLGKFPDILLHVKSAKIVPTGLKLNKSKITELGTTKTYQLKATFVPDNATETNVFWKSSDESIATVDENGLVTARRYGKVIITATSEADSRLSAGCEIQTRFKDALSTNVEKETFHAIYWAADHKITGEQVRFGTNSNMTRGQFVRFLYRFVGNPKVTKAMIKKYGKQFSDVDDGYTHYKAIVWAVSKGLIAGYKDGTFKPGKSLSRNNVATILWKYAGSPKVSNTKKPFADVSKSAAIAWGKSKEIFEGDKNNRFRPKTDCLRGDFAVFLYRYNQKYKVIR